MPSIQRPLAGDVLVFDLAEERDRTADESIIDRSGRNGRTLLKSGNLRMTLVVVGPGGEIPEHRAEGPITVQPTEGRIRFSAGGEDYHLQPGQLLACGPGVAHTVTSEEGGTFLLTVAHDGRTSPRGAEE